MAAQNRNLVKTTITFESTLDSYIIMLPRNKRSTYEEREIYLHADGETIDYIHYYELERVDENLFRFNKIKPHNNYNSRKNWIKYKNLCE